MRVKISISGPRLLDTASKEVFSVTGETLKDALEDGRNEHEEALGRLSSEALSPAGHVSVLLNGKTVKSPEDLDVPLREGDEISIVPAISGGKEMKRRIYLNIPKNIVGQPILFQVGHEFNIVTNIRGASISEEVGLVALEITGEKRELERAIKWLALRGVEVEQVPEPEIRN